MAYLRAMARRIKTPRPRDGALPQLAESAPCPCGSGRPYGECCGALHSGRAAAATAQLLMRARYSAFAVHDAEFLLKSWHPSTRPRQVDFDPRVRWSRLEIVATGDGGPFHRSGTVEFRAHYTERGQPGEQREVSRFVREDGEWVYLGPLPPERTRPGVAVPTPPGPRTPRV